MNVSPFPLFGAKRPSELQEPSLNVFLCFVSVLQKVPFWGILLFVFIYTLLESSRKLTPSHTPPPYVDMHVLCVQFWMLLVVPIACVA